MKKLIWIMLMGIILTGCSVPTDQPNPQPAAKPEEKTLTQDVQIENLIKQLGDEDWQSREKAQQELIKIGEPIKPYFQEELRSKYPNSEVRLRSKQVWKEISRNSIKQIGRIWWCNNRDLISTDIAGEGRKSIEIVIEKLPVEDRSLSGVIPQPHGRKMLLSFGGGALNRPHALYLLNTEDHYPIEIAFFPAGGSRIGPVAWSPNGKMIAYITGQFSDKNNSIHIYDVDKKQHLEEFDAILSRCYNPLFTQFYPWTSDSRCLVGMSWKKNDKQNVIQLWKLNIISKEENLLCTMTMPAIYDERWTGWSLSPEGNDLAVITSELIVIGQRQYTLSLYSDDKLVQTYKDSSNYVGWAPDGKKIAFWARSEDQGYGLYCYDFVTRSRITILPPSVANPSSSLFTWFDSERLLVVLPSTSGKEHKIILFPLTGEPGQTMVEDGADNGSPIIVPDGKLFLFYRIMASRQMPQPVQMSSIRGRDVRYALCAYDVVERCEIVLKEDSHFGSEGGAGKGFIVFDCR